MRPHRLSLINNTVVHICCVFFHCDPDLPFEFWAFQLRKHLNGGYQNRPRIFLETVFLVDLTKFVPKMTSWFQVHVRPFKSRVRLSFQMFLIAVSNP